MATAHGTADRHIGEGQLERPALGLPLKETTPGFWALSYPELFPFGFNVMNRRMRDQGDSMTRAFVRQQTDTWRCHSGRAAATGSRGPAAEGALVGALDKKAEQIM